MKYTVHELAQRAGISIRTLHYYDEIGLLKPSFVARNGYRHYEEKEMIRLQQILFFRELDFPLLDIKKMMAAPEFNVLDALRDQKKLVELKRKRLDGLLRSITKTLKTMENQTPINGDELYDALKDDDVKQYQDEVKARWGNSDAYKQSHARVSKMTKAEIEKLKEDGNKLAQKLADAMQLPVESTEVQNLIAEHHKGINFFYECSTEMYRNLGKMYVDDARFTAYYDKFAPGLAVFVRDAIAHYCDIKEKKV